jgi:DNA-binding transcriptional ArsR family regulator
MDSRVFETLADPTRRRILETLRRGERPVFEIVKAARVRQSGVSRHLGILHKAGFVRVRAVAQRRCYSLEPAPFRELERWVGQYEELWESRLDRMGAELARRKTTGPPTKRTRSEEPR